MPNFIMPRVHLRPRVEYKMEYKSFWVISQIYITRILTPRDDKQYSWSDFTFCFPDRLAIAAYV